MADDPASDFPVLNGEILAEAASLLAEDFSTLLRFFMQDSPRLLTELEQACRASNHETAIRLTHTLKSSSRQLGLMRLSSLSALAETKARESGTFPVEELPKLQDALAQALTALELATSQESNPDA